MANPRACSLGWLSVLLRWTALAACLCSVLARASENGRSLAARVILVANRNNPESVELARFYARKRGIPLANLFTYPMPAAETISWPEFVSAIWNPLLRDLVKTNWIDAIPMEVWDKAGRHQYAVNDDRIAYLVVFRGVPLRVADDPALRDTPYPLALAKEPEFRTASCAVDSELTLLARSLHPIVSFVPNPLFHDDRRQIFGDNRVVKVCRIDGPTLKDAEGIIERGIEVERRGLIGRAYVDTDGPFPAGNEWFEKTIREIRRLGFDLDVDRTPSTMPVTARFDAPALYFGWYTGTVNGPFELPGARMEAGALAYHLYSFSAATLRSATTGWCGPLIAKGAAATLGNVYEPYLNLTHRPDYFLEALERQWTLGDAAYYATPALSWQEIVVGDPLYRPFATSLDTQWDARATLGARLSGYVTLREMNLMDASRRYAQAIRVGEQEMEVRPSVALAYGVAVRLARQGDQQGVRHVLERLPALDLANSQNWTLVRDCARLLDANGGAEAALGLYARILARPGMPKDERILLLTEAAPIAETLGEGGQADAWRKELATLNPGSQP